MQMLCHNRNKMLNYLISNVNYNIAALIAGLINCRIMAINVGQYSYIFKKA